MDLIIGGAYQGKLDYARKQYNLTDEDICDCGSGAAPDLSRRCIYHFELLVRRQLAGTGSFAMPDLRCDAVIIADDISCGVVPIETDIRLWREETGRALTALAARADTVTRIFCGLPARIK